MATKIKNEAAIQLGRLGGSKKSAAKTAANKANIYKRWSDYKQNGGKKNLK